MCGFIPALRWMFTYGRWYFFVVEIYNIILIYFAQELQDLYVISYQFYDPTFQQSNTYGIVARIVSIFGMIGTIVIAIIDKPNISFVFEDYPFVSHL